MCWNNEAAKPGTKGSVNWGDGCVSHFGRVGEELVEEELEDKEVWVAHLSRSVGAISIMLAFSPP